MELNIGNRLKHAWNAFLNRDPTYSYGVSGSGYSFRPDKARLSRGNEKLNTVKSTTMEDS